MGATSNYLDIGKSPLRVVEEACEDKSEAISKVVVIGYLDIKFFAENAFTTTEDNSGLTLHFNSFLV